MSRKYEIFCAVIDAWKARDVERLASHLHENLVWHYAAGHAPPILGKAKAQRAWQRFAETLSTVEWRIFDHAERGETLFVEGVDEYTRTDGVRVVAPYTGVLEFDGDLIVGWRDYVDLTVIQAMKAGGPVPDHVQGLVDRVAV